MLTAETNNGVTSPVMNRRRFLGGAAVAVAGIISSPSPVTANEIGAAKTAPPGSGKRYQVAVCDWMILKRQKD